MLLAGAWNCRVGNKPDFVVCDRTINDIDYVDYIPDAPLCRASQDSLCNARGVKMLDLCKGSNMRIANGLLGSDYNCGSFTYYNRQTNSTIDYLLLNENDFHMVSSFEIGQFNMFSDHAPLPASIRPSIQPLSIRSSLQPVSIRPSIQPLSIRSSLQSASICVQQTKHSSSLN